MGHIAVAAGRKLCRELTQERRYGPVHQCGLQLGHPGPHGSGARHERPALDHRPRHAATEQPYRGAHRPRPRHGSGGVAYGDPHYSGRHRPQEYTQPTLPQMPRRKPIKVVRDPAAGETFGLNTYGKRAAPLGVAQRVNRATRKAKRRGG